MRIFVTGGTGFIGTQLVTTLAKAGHEVTALVRDPARATHLSPGVRRAIGHLHDTSALQRGMAGAEAVIHLAGLLAEARVGEMERVNVAGTGAVARAAVAAGARRLVYVSSIAAAGPSAPGRPWLGHELPRPISAYGRTKLAGEDAARSATGQLEVVVARPPAVYGPMDRSTLPMFRLARLPVVPLVSPVHQPTAIVHVDDLARGIEACATAAGASGVYYFSVSPVPTLGHLMGLLGRAVTGRAPRLVRVPRLPSVAAAHAASIWQSLTGRAAIFNNDKLRELTAPGWDVCTQRAQRDLGWQPTIRLEDGLARAAAAYRAAGWL